MTWQRPTMGVLALFAGLGVAFGIWGGQPDVSGPSAPASQRETAPPPRPLRQAWTTSRVVGSPDPPPPYLAVRAFPQAQFHEPVFMVRIPGEDRFFVGERKGTLYTLAHQAQAQPQIAFDFRTQTQSPPPPQSRGVNNLYALACHPRFTHNRYVYVCYTFAHQKRGQPNLADGSRISRFTVTRTDPPRLDPASEQVIISWESGGHNGCEILFGPDGYLYFSTGDAREPNPPDKLNTGQDCSDLLSCILRIDVDRVDPGRAYAIPPDNPFIGRDNVRPEIWAYGLRNPWRMSFDRATGDLWVADVGWELWEMVYRVSKGANFGWSITEGPQPIKPGQDPGPTPTITPPTIALPHTIAASVTGGFVYRGLKFPELQGAYLFGDWEFRRWWAARFDRDGKLASLQEITRPSVRVSSYAEDHAGEIYALDYDTGWIMTLARNDSPGANTAFPTRLSQTGLFTDLTRELPAEGVYPFLINVAQWQDGATARHWIALPGTESVTVYPADGKPMPSQVYWHKFRLHFPKNAVLVKTLYLEEEPGNAATRKKVETQLLHFDDAGDWRAYTYAWREDGQDADLVPAGGAERLLRVRDPRRSEGEREVVWSFSSRTQCMTCHSQWPQYALAFSLPQLNREVPDGFGGTTNQLVRFSQMGLLQRKSLRDEAEPAYTEPEAAREPRFYDPAGSEGTLDERARSYLHVNCSHCHRFNGGGVVSIELNADKPLAGMQVVEAAPQRGDFGLPGARIVATGAPERSTLLYRMMKFGKDRMPKIGTDWPDPVGCELIARWIRTLDDPFTSSTWAEPPTTNADPAQFLQSPARAMPYALALAQGRVPAPLRDRWLAEAAKLPTGPTRELFDAYFPQHGQARKLGPNPRPAAILSLTGNAQRGEALFWSNQTQCANCHRLGDRGTALGPDLTTIGKLRSREEILESLLEPSRRIDPPFLSYTLRTVDGKAYAGLLVKRDATAIVLRDAQNKEWRIPADEVETFQPSRISLMPEALLAPFTPQEAADLLEFLATRK